MQISASRILLVIAVVLFILAGLGFGPEVNLNLTALGLAALAASMYVERLAAAR